MLMNINTYYGRLIYNDQGEYELHSPTGIVNISHILKNIYFADNNYIKIKIMNGCKVLFNEEGNLYLKVIIKPKLASYHVNGNDLETVLFDLVGQDLEILLFAEALEGDKYGTKITTK